MSIGDKIKELRLKNRVTQEELATKLNISTQAVSKWENGGYPDLDLVPEIANYFNVTTDFLFDRVGVLLSDDDIEKILIRHIYSLKREESFKRIFKLGYIMSVAIRNGDMDLHLNEYDIDSYDERWNTSAVVEANGVAITSLIKNNYFFSIFPKSDGYKKIFDSKEKQIKLCKYLSNELFYDALVFLYSHEHKNFTEKLLINELNYNKDDSIDILNKLKEFKFIKEKIVEVDGESIHFYETKQFPEIVGLFAYLDLVSKAICSYSFYFGGPTNYFNKKENMND